MSQIPYILHAYSPCRIDQSIVLTWETYKPIRNPSWFITLHIKRTISPNVSPMSLYWIIKVFWDNCSYHESTYESKRLRWIKTMYESLESQWSSITKVYRVLRMFSIPRVNTWVLIRLSGVRIWVATQVSLLKSLSSPSTQSKTTCVLIPTDTLTSEVSF